MASEQELLMNSMTRLKRAISRNTGTSFSDEEVQVVGKVLYALGSSVLPSPAGRRVCRVCGQPDHGDAAIVGAYPPHNYEPGLLVPLVNEEE